MASQVIGPNQEKWLKALESGEYRQGREFLTMIDESGECDCCLGVACKLMGSPRRNIGAAFSYEDCTEAAPKSLIKWLALHNDVGAIKGMLFDSADCLTEANDDGKNFQDIAAFCRANPSAVFTEPR